MRFKFAAFISLQLPLTKLLSPTRYCLRLVLEGGALPLHVLGERVSEWASGQADGIKGL